MASIFSLLLLVVLPAIATLVSSELLSHLPISVDPYETPITSNEQQIFPLPILLPPSLTPGGTQQPPITTPTENQPGQLKSFTNGKGYYKKMAREFLQAHNQVRAVEGEAPYRWDKRVARFARRWAETRKADCTMIHSHGPYGENMFWGTGWDWRATDAVKNWAEERNHYFRVNNSCLPGQMCGHFTQIVWNSTVSVGCARVECHGGGVIISCNYDPPGNWLDESPFTSTSNM